METKTRARLLIGPVAVGLLAGGGVAPAAATAGPGPAKGSVTVSAPKFGTQAKKSGDSSDFLGTDVALDESGWDATEANESESEASEQSDEREQHSEDDRDAQQNSRHEKPLGGIEDAADAQELVPSVAADSEGEQNGAKETDQTQGDQQTPEVTAGPTEEPSTGREEASGNATNSIESESKEDQTLGNGAETATQEQPTPEEPSPSNSKGAKLSNNATGDQALVVPDEVAAANPAAAQLAQEIAVASALQDDSVASRGALDQQQREKREREEKLGITTPVIRAAVLELLAANGRYYDGPDNYDTEITAADFRYINYANIDSKNADLISILPAFTDLRALSISGIDSEVVELSGFTKLQSLSLGSGVKAATLADMPALDYLSISASVSTLSLSGMSSLNQLYFETGKWVDDEWIQVPSKVTSLSLSGLSALENLQIPESVAELSLSGMGALTQLNFQSGQWVDDEWINLPSNVTKLSLSDLPGLTYLNIPESVKEVNLSGLTGLEGLSYENKSQVRTVSVSDLPALKWINLPNLVKDVALANLPSLEYLNIPSGKICQWEWDEATKTSSWYDCVNAQAESVTLKNLPGLRNLSIPESVKEFSFSGLPNLEWVGLTVGQALNHVDELARWGGMVRTEFVGSDLSALESLNKLSNPLSLSFGVTTLDISTLVGLKNLQELDFWYIVEVTNLNDLSKLANLKTLVTNESILSDLTPLLKLNSLEKVHFYTDIPIADEYALCSNDATIDSLLSRGVRISQEGSGAMCANRDRVLEPFAGGKPWSGFGDLVARLNDLTGDFKGIRQVGYGGGELDRSNYEISSDGATITLNESYLKSLADGTYKFVVLFGDDGWPNNLSGDNRIDLYLVIGQTAEVPGNPETSNPGMQPPATPSNPAPSDPGNQSPEQPGSPVQRPVVPIVPALRPTVPNNPEQRPFAPNNPAPQPQPPIWSRPTSGGSTNPAGGAAQRPGNVMADLPALQVPVLTEAVRPAAEWTTVSAALSSASPQSLVASFSSVATAPSHVPGRLLAAAANTTARIEDHAFVSSGVGTTPAPAPKADLAPKWETLGTVVGENGRESAGQVVKAKPALIKRIATKIWRGFKHAITSALGFIVDLVRNGLLHLG